MAQCLRILPLVSNATFSLTVTLWVPCTTIQRWFDFQMTFLERVDPWTHSLIWKWRGYLPSLPCWPMFCSKAPSKCWWTCGVCKTMKCPPRVANSPSSFAPSITKERSRRACLKICWQSSRPTGWAPGPHGLETTFGLKFNNFWIQAFLPASRAREIQWWVFFRLKLRASRW